MVTLLRGASIDTSVLSLRLGAARLATFLRAHASVVARLVHMILEACCNCEMAWRQDTSDVVCFSVRIGVKRGLVVSFVKWHSLWLKLRHKNRLPLDSKTAPKKFCRRAW